MSLDDSPSHFRIRSYYGFNRTLKPKKVVSCYSIAALGAAVFGLITIHEERFSDNQFWTVVAIAALLCTTITGWLGVAKGGYHNLPVTPGFNRLWTLTLILNVVSSVYGIFVMSLVGPFKSYIVFLNVWMLVNHIVFLLAVVCVIIWAKVKENEPLNQREHMIENLLTVEGPTIDQPKNRERSNSAIYLGEYALPSLPQVQWNTSIGMNECPMCLEEYTVGEYVLSLPCFHYYHKECVYEWLQRTHRCPSCSSYFSEPGKQV